MVRLVEAVKFVNVKAAEAELGILEEEDEQGVPDGRIWPRGVGMMLTPNVRAEGGGEDVPERRDLLRHAQQTVNGFYVVERSATRSTRSKP